MRVLDVLSISHFAIWYIIGFYLPNRYDLFIIFSLLWEILESLIPKNPAVYQWFQKYWIIPESYWNEPIENKLSDLFFNFCGFMIASNSRKDPLNVFAMFLVYILSVFMASKQS